MAGTSPSEQLAQTLSLNDQLRTENEQLRAENEALRDRVTRLESEMGRHSENSSKPVCHER